LERKVAVGPVISSVSNAMENQWNVSTYNPSGLLDGPPQPSVSARHHLDPSIRVVFCRASSKHLPSDHPIDQLTTTEQSSVSLCEDWYNFTPVVDVRDVQTGP